MASDHSQYVPRRPRHAATGESGYSVRVTRALDAGTGEPSGAESDSTFPADLVDLSRDGFCLRSAASAPVGSLLTIELRHDQGGLALTLRGEVRWQRPQADGRWLLGCHSEQQIDWATLGELFLNNVLVAQPRESNSGIRNSDK